MTELPTSLNLNKEQGVDHYKKRAASNEAALFLFVFFILTISLIVPSPIVG